jgi:hypothetical protein
MDKHFHPTVAQGYFKAKLYQLSSSAFVERIGAPIGAVARRWRPAQTDYRRWK